MMFPLGYSFSSLSSYTFSESKSISKNIVLQAQGKLFMYKALRQISSPHCNIPEGGVITLLHKVPKEILEQWLSSGLIEKIVLPELDGPKGKKGKSNGSSAGV